jgi:hypothetical protein
MTLQWWASHKGKESVCLHKNNTQDEAWRAKGHENILYRYMKLKKIVRYLGASEIWQELQQKIYVMFKLYCKKRYVSHVFAWAW